MNIKKYLSKYFKYSRLNFQVFQSLLRIIKIHQNQLINFKKEYLNTKKNQFHKLNSFVLKNKMAQIIFLLLKMLLQLMIQQHQQLFFYLKKLV